MSHSTAARLLKEFASESKDPNPAIRALSPVSEDDIFTWNGWLRGINSTPYEGIIFKDEELTVRRRMASEYRYS